MDLPSPGRRLGPFTVSGVCFSPDDLHLAASTWASPHNAGPTLLFEVSGLELTLKETLTPARQHDHRPFAPTGVLLCGKYLIVRNHRAHVENVIRVTRPSRGLGVNHGSASRHLTSSRIIVAPKTVITGCGGLIPWQELEADPSWRASGKAADGLVAVPLKGNPQQTLVIPVQDWRRIGAVGARPSEDAFITGGLDGELDAWSWTGSWQQHRLRPAPDRKGIAHPDRYLVWATYNPNSIVGICSLCDGDRWVSVSARRRSLSLGRIPARLLLATSGTGNSSLRCGSSGQALDCSWDQEGRVRKTPIGDRAGRNRSCGD